MNLNILIVGVGYHSRRIYVPFFKKEGFEFGAKLCHGIDLINQEEIISNYLNEIEFSLPMSYVSNSEGDELDQANKDIINKIVEKNNIDSVIISTEPLCHFKYAKWALEKGLNILMDKPITTENGVSTEVNKAIKIRQDYDILENLYNSAKLSRPNLVFSLMAQRRFHPAFSLIKNKIEEVFSATNCPITSVQSFHSDGQWRFPTEIVEQNYHPYNQGYGKASHSGYHSIDMLTWLIDSTNKGDKRYDNINIYSSVIRPNDFLKQMNLSDYRKIFADFDKYNKFDENILKEKMTKFGEIDIFNNITFKQGNSVIILGSVNLVHNGFSQRSWATADGRDLYKGNGRVRHESHYIEQGPFQSISFISYQSKEINPASNKNLYEVGGEYHLDVHIFRNSALYPQWKAYEVLHLNDILNKSMTGHSRGHQEDARRLGIVDFIKSIQDEKKSESDFLDHRNSTYILSGIYESTSNQFNNLTPLVNIII